MDRYKMGNGFGSWLCACPLVGIIPRQAVATCLLEAKGSCLNSRSQFLNFEGRYSTTALSVRTEAYSSYERKAHCGHLGIGRSETTKIFPSSALYSLENFVLASAICDATKRA